MTSSRVSFLPPVGDEIAMSPSFSDSTFLAFAQRSQDSDALEAPHPPFDETKEARPSLLDDANATYLTDPRRLSLANTTFLSTDINASCLNADIIYRVTSTPVKPTSSHARLLSTKHIDVVNTACMLEDQLRDMEQACAEAEERCKEKRRRIKELEAQVLVMDGQFEDSDVNPFLDPSSDIEEGEDDFGVSEERRVPSGRINPVKRAIGLGLDDFIICDTLDCQVQPPAARSVEDDDSTVNGHPSPTVSSLVHQEIQNSYVFHDGMSLPHFGGEIDNEKEKQKTTRASSFRNMIGKYAVRQTLEGIERKYKISGTLRRRNINMLHPSSPRSSDDENQSRSSPSPVDKSTHKRSFTHSIRNKMMKSLGRQRSSPKRVPLMESSALKAFLKSSKVSDTGGVSMSLKGSWRKRRGSLKDKENVVQTDSKPVRRRFSAVADKDFEAYLRGEEGPRSKASVTPTTIRQRHRRSVTLAHQESQEEGECSLLAKKVQIAEDPSLDTGHAYSTVKKRRY
ncbi:hypothetical protein NEOLEDRAFT_1148331 [Neolentinus lepideus HHB14362 ss-1]|uniref:Uncharacterized protein n=1 Tax=Neolentinus lepideus HHB14362 ss-1 TaxID=1314782 RepID=A0A165SFY3_9AGAM|nr:hypothetical protein NEOLEDRAFT_1148331 [Neolentinus lepideus HHB14362 ss-1]